jgi:DNA-binding response OmpR family regulator
MPRILVVDDEPELLKALCVRLTAEGFTCETASNGREALERIEAQLPDLMILDLIMPEVTGYEVCRQLQDDPRTAALPVLVLTAVPQRAIIQTAELGAATILHKPFDTAILLATVRHLLKLPSPGGVSNG